MSVVPLAVAGLGAVAVQAVGVAAWSRRQLHDVERYLDTVVPLAHHRLVRRWMRRLVARRRGPVATGAILAIAPAVWPRVQRGVHRRAPSSAILALASIATLASGAGRRRALSWVLATALISVLLVALASG